jgi:hypothetical protein
LEVTVLTRRIVISACALCLAIPTAASASAATDPPKAKGPYGITTTTDPHNIVKAKGPYGITSATDPHNIVKAKGPYGITVATGSQSTTTATAHPADATGGDGMNDWRTAAISEAALLAALALGSALLLPARRRAPRLGT